MDQNYRLYKPQNGAAICTGVVKAVSPDRMVVTIASGVYENAPGGQKGKVYVAKDLVLRNPIPMGEEIEAGKTLTAVVQNSLTNANEYEIRQLLPARAQEFEMPQVTVISGRVSKFEDNEELDENGNHKLKQDGVTPRKPHTDLTIFVKETSPEDPDGHYVRHVVKVYDSPRSQVSDRARIKKMLSGFDPAKHTGENRTEDFYVTLVTQNGTPLPPMQRADGTVSYMVTHMGVRAVTGVTISEHQRYIDRTQQAAPAQAAPTPVAPVQQAAPVPTAQAPAQAPAQPAMATGTGFAPVADNLELGEDELPFN